MAYARLAGRLVPHNLSSQADRSFRPQFCTRWRELRMAVATTLSSTVLTSTPIPNDISPAVSQAIETTINTVVDAASKSGNTDVTAPNDTLLQIAIWIVDA